MQALLSTAKMIETLDSAFKWTLAFLDIIETGFWGYIYLGIHVPRDNCTVG